jgi:hypothetical protein
VGGGVVAGRVRVGPAGRVGPDSKCSGIGEGPRLLTVAYDSSCLPLPSTFMASALRGSCYQMREGVAFVVTGVFTGCLVVVALHHLSSDLPPPHLAPPSSSRRQDLGSSASYPTTPASTSSPDQAASIRSDLPSKQLHYIKRWFDELVPPGSWPGACSIAGDDFQIILRSPCVCLQHSVDPSSTDAQHGLPSGFTRPWRRRLSNHPSVTRCVPSTLRRSVFNRCSAQSPI